jgi:hypothetical protein
MSPSKHTWPLLPCLLQDYMPLQQCPSDSGVTGESHVTHVMEGQRRKVIKDADEYIVDGSSRAS